MRYLDWRRLVVAGALCALAAGASAADDVGKWYVTPIVYGVRTGTDRHVGDGPEVGVIVGKNTSENWSLELEFGHASYTGSVVADDSLRIDSLSVNALRHFYRDSAIHPFLSVGFVESNETRTQVGNYQRNQIATGLGLLGTAYTAPDKSKVVQLRFEAKERWHITGFADPNQGTPNDFLVGLGLQVAFGAPAPAPAPVAKEFTAPAPSPAPAPAPPPPPAKCPGTPAGVPVDADGCPLDSDHDGVPDYLDKCPGTPPGVKVDAKGCEVEAIVLKGVNFDFDSATLTPASEKVLDDVAALLKMRTGAPATIGGHTDGKGKHAYNLKLSQRRAAAVRDYLIAKGIAAGSLTATGYGDTQPIASNATEEGRAQNRRVTLEFKRYEMR